MNAGVVFTLGLMVVMAVIILSFIMMVVDLRESTQEKLDDPYYCDQVYDRPEEFLPEDGTLEEKLQRCDDFMNGNGQAMVSALDSMLIFLLIIPVLGVGYFIISFIKMKPGNDGTDPHDRTHYDPDWKGYGK